MRLYRVQLTNKKLKTYLKDLARIYRIPDVGFVEDLFCMIRVKGKLPAVTDEALKLLAEEAQKKSSARVSPVGIKIMAVKRRTLFKRMVQSALGVAALKLNDPLEALRRLLTCNESVAEKLAASTCRSCKLLQYCKFGKKYGKAVRNILSAFALAESNEDVHPECPYRAKFTDSQEQMREVQQFMEQLASSRASRAKVSVNPDSGAEESSSGVKIGKPSTEDPDEITDEEVEALMAESSLREEEATFDGYIDEDTPKIISPSFSAGDPSMCYRTSHSSGASMFAAEEQIHKLAKTDLDLFFLAKRIAETLAKLESDELKETLAVTSKSKQSTIR